MEQDNLTTKQPNMSLIFEKLAAIQQDINPIGKNQKNAGQGFMFRGVDAVYNALHPLLAKHEVFTTSKIINAIREEKQTKNGGTVIYSIIDVEFTFYAKDGSNVSTQARGEVMDSGDKASNKEMAVAHKYALTQTFTIPYEGMVDPDSETHQLADALDTAIAGLVDCDNKEAVGLYFRKQSPAVQKNAKFIAACKTASA
jgi:hypothetical protein